jgi:hypothetical protein
METKYCTDLIANKINAIKYSKMSTIIRGETLKVKTQVAAIR